MINDYEKSLLVSHLVPIEIIFANDIFQQELAHKMQLSCSSILCRPPDLWGLRYDYIISHVVLRYTNGMNLVHIV